MTAIRIHITDDHIVFRCGLKAFIEQQVDLRVVSEAAEHRETLERVRAAKPDVVILDVNDPRRSVTQLAQCLIEETPALGLLILTVHSEEHYLRECLRIGARGFLVKTSTGEELIEAIRKIHRGEQYVDPQLSGYLIANFIGRARKIKEGLQQLTGREREICRYLATGYTNAEVAESLNISKRTVETHRAAIMSKMRLKNRFELVNFAMDNGLLPQNGRVIN